MSEYVKFILNGCDIAFIATAPKEIDSMPDDEFERLFKEALACS